MKSTNFDFLGGFPLDQSILKRLQETIFQHIKTYALQIGCQEVGNYILYGCEIDGANITPGAMFINGEICPFAGSIGDATTKIRKVTTTTTAPFFNGTNPPVFIETVAQVDALGTPLSDFIRFNFVDDPNYVHTDNNFTTALLNKLNSLAIQVQADWNVVNPASFAFIKNKPTILNVLDHGTFLLGNPGNASYPITFDDPLSTADYTVLIGFESTTATALDSATVLYSVHSRTVDGFQIAVREIGNFSQVLTINYLIIANN